MLTTIATIVSIVTNLSFLATLAVFLYGINRKLHPRTR